MSLDELRDDLKRNIAEARSIQTFEQLRDHVVNTVWPFIEAKLDVIDEMDDSMAEMIDHQEDYLQPDTAAIFAAVVQFGLTMGAELKKRAAGDKDVLTIVAQHEQLCAQAVEVLGAITMLPTDEGEDDDEDEAVQEVDGTDHE